jgi:hypothetical protein
VEEGGHGYLALNIKTKIINIKAIDAGTHIGAITHHHDQLITLHNLRTIKAISKSVKPLAPPAVLLSLIFLFFIVDKYVSVLHTPPPPSTGPAVPALTHHTTCS